MSYYPTMPPPPPPGPPTPRRTPWGWIIAAVVVVLVLVAGGIVAVVTLGGDDDTTADDAATGDQTPAGSSSPTPSTTSSAAPSESSSAAVDTSAVVGDWQGTYTCAQGDTGLSLDIIARSDTELSAIFHFRKIPQNPDVPEGSYKMTGSLVDGKLRLRREAWIDRPAGYVMVGLNARVTDPGVDQLTGTVSNVGCQEFTITRQ